LTEIFRVMAIGFILLFLITILKELGFKGAKLISTVGIVTLSVIALDGIRSLTDSFFSGLGVSAMGDITVAVMKILGAGYVFGITSDILRDSGESGIANAILTVGRVEILLMCTPFISRLIEVFTEVMK